MFRHLYLIIRDFLHLCLAKLKLLKLQFYEIIKLLFNRCFVFPYSLFDVTIFCASSVYLWLHIHSLVDVSVLTLHQHTDNVLHKIYMQLHNYKSMIIHKISPKIIPSLHTTPHFSLPRAFGRFVTTLQKASLLTYNYFPNPLSKVPQTESFV